MEDYLKNDMSPISCNEPNPAHVCYLSHHSVAKREKTTTKLRVGFNASARGIKGLNVFFL